MSDQPVFLVPRTGPMLALHQLIETYGQRWVIQRADRHIWTVTRTWGTSTRILAGTPPELLAKLDAMPSGAGPTILRIVTPGFLSGQLPPGGAA